MRRLKTTSLPSRALSCNCSNTVKEKNKKNVTLLANSGSLATSNYSTKPTIYKYSRLSLVCSAIAEVYLLNYYKRPRNTTLTPPGVHFSASANMFNNFI